MARPLQNRPQWPLKLANKDVQEVLISGRWIRLRVGTYYEDEDRVVFLSEDGKHYETTPECVHLRVGQHGPTS
jgi:hypothetical protein